MRTTIRLDDPLLRRAKATAASHGQSLNDFISDAVRAALGGRSRAAEAPPLPTCRGRGLQPGVDLDDNAALLGLMEEPRELLRARRVAEPAPRRSSRSGSK